MTREEAAEIVLANEPNIRCPFCTDDRLRCSTCHGVRWVVNLDWVEANAMLETMSEKEALFILSSAKNRWVSFRDKVVTSPEYVLAAAVFGLPHLVCTEDTQFNVYMRVLSIYREKHGLGTLVSTG